MKQPISHIFLPFEISIQNLEERLNQDLADGKVLFDDDEFLAVPRQMLSLMQVKYKVQVIKQGRIELRGRSGGIYATVPLQIRIFASFTPMNSFLGKEQTIETTGDITMLTKTQLSLKENWQFVTEPKIISYEWGKNLRLKVLGLSLDMSWLKERTILTLLPQLLPKLDKYLLSEMHLQDEFALAWETIQKPNLLHDAPRIWMHIQTKQLRISSFRIEEGHLRLLSQLDAGLGIQIGEMPARKAPIALPPATITALQEEASVLTIPVTITYPVMSRLLREQMVGDTYELGKRYQVRVEDIKLRYKNGEIMAEVWVSGVTNGRAFVYGVPKYDRVKKLFYLDEVRFELDASDKVLQFTSWLLPNTIGRLIQRSLRFPLTAKFIRLESYINDWLAYQELGDDLYIGGAVEKTALVDFQFDKERVTLLLRLEGWVSASLVGSEEEE